MKPWGRATREAYLALPLRAHRLLAAVPLHDVWRVRLDGSHREATLAEARSVALALARSGSTGVPLSTLFRVRRWLGSVFRWDRTPEGVDATPDLDLSSTDLQASLVPPGTRDGPFTVVYAYSDEALSHIRNATVEAYLVWAINPVAGGHELLWAIHVRPVSAWTRPYMTLIGPFRRFLVYPALLRAFHEEWSQCPDAAS